MRLEEFEHALILFTGLIFRMPEATRNSSTPYSRTHSLNESISYFTPEYVTIHRGTLNIPRNNFLYNLVQEYLRNNPRKAKVENPKRPIIEAKKNRTRTYYAPNTLPRSKWLRSRGY